MKGIVLCSDIETLRKSLPTSPTPLFFLVLTDTPEGFAARSYLREHRHAEELPREELFRDRSEAFRGAYVRAMGQLNAAFASLSWWAMPFTTKNPIASRLCRRVFSLLLIAELALSERDGWLVIITDDCNLAESVMQWAHSRRL